MAQIKAFPCIHPKPELTARIAALPYDVYNRSEAKAETKKEPLSFLSIDRAETQLGDEVETYAPEVYQKAHDILWDMVEKGQFVKETKPCYYLYELTMEGRSQTGLVACTSIDDYLSGVIKKHENTRADKEADRIRHVDVCNAQTGPIFLAYRKNQNIQKVVDKTKAGEPMFSFVSDDGVSHRGFRITEPSDIKTIAEEFRKIDQIYIADGHHRAASAVQVGIKRRKEHPVYDGTEEFNYFLSVLFPDEELMIMDYNRVVKDLNGLDTEVFLGKVKEKFFVDEMDKQEKPKKRGQISMYLKDTWYGLTARAEASCDNPADSLDVSVLQNEILYPILGIENPKTDNRIDFIGGIRGLDELERRVREDCAVAFAMYPTSIQELFAVADAGLLMPPKSTWFEPKLRSGLFIHEIGK